MYKPKQVNGVLSTQRYCIPENSKPGHTWQHHLQGCLSREQGHCSIGYYTNQQPPSSSYTARKLLVITLQLSFKESEMLMWQNRLPSWQWMVTYPIYPEYQCSCPWSKWRLIETGELKPCLEYIYWRSSPHWWCKYDTLGAGMVDGHKSDLSSAQWELQNTINSKQRNGYAMYLGRGQQGSTAQVYILYPII